MDPLSVLFDVIVDRVSRLVPPRVAWVFWICFFGVLALFAGYFVVALTRV